MRAAAILGLGRSLRDLEIFRSFDAEKQIEWRIGAPATADDADVVLIFGGDGTIHRHLPKLVELRLPVLIVPAGSGNDFARQLGLRRVRHSLEAWQAFLSGKRNGMTVDLGTITPIEGAHSTLPLSQNRHDPAPGVPRYFGSVAGVGLDSEVTRRANSLPAWLRAHGGYALALAPAIFHFAPLRTKVLTKGADGSWMTRWDRHTMLAAFANTSTYGDGMRIAPHAEMNDGLLDVCVIGGMHGLKLACMFPTVYFGRHLRLREVTYFQAERIRVETAAPLDVYADGEYVCQTPVEISTERAMLRVIAHPSHTGL